jgi:hypothetical protein
VIVPPANTSDPTVPVNVTLPNGASVQTGLARSDVGRIVCAVGGAALGILCFVLGGKYGGKWMGRA